MEEPTSEGISHMQTCEMVQNNGKESPIPSQYERRETELQTQQIHDAEPVATQNVSEQEVFETEAPSWVNSHILELSNTYGVAFVGFEEETMDLLMRIDEKESGT